MIEEKYLIAYFGKQSGYYLEKYNDFIYGNRISFNIGPFFGGPLWFAYRKLYSHVGAIFAILILLQITEEFLYEANNANLETQKGVSFIITLFLSISYGYFGNLLYLKNSIKNILRILNETGISEEIRIDKLQRKGGVSWPAVIIIMMSIIAMVLLSLVFVQEGV
jgi:hypothetical protein